jgi:hypothetical protein
MSWIQLLSLAFARDVVVDVPLGSWERVDLGVWVDGEDAPRSVECTPGASCGHQGLPDGRRLWVTLEAPGTGVGWWLDADGKNDDLRPDLYFGRTVEWIHHVDLDGQPVPTVHGGYAKASLFDGRTPVRHSTQDPIPADRTVVLPVRRLTRRPAHRLVADRPVDFRSHHRPIENPAGYWLPVGTWYEEWIDDRGPHRIRYDVPATGGIRIRRERPRAIPVTWAAPPDGDGSIEGEPLWLTTGPTSAVVHPRRGRPATVRGWVAVEDRQLPIGEARWAPGDDAVELAFEPDHRLECLSLHEVPAGLFVQDANVRRDDAGLAEVVWGWVLTHIDDDAIAGWTREEMLAELGENGADAVHTFTFATPTGDRALSSPLNATCR